MPKAPAPIPDYFGKLLAYRAWNVEGLSLKSVAGNTLWVPGTNTATCYSTKSDKCPHCGEMIVYHPCPSRQCGCGWNCFKSPFHDQLHMWLRPQAICGAIKIWGRCIEHRSGYRAQYAEVVLLATRNVGLCKRYKADQFIGTWTEFCELLTK